MSFELQPVTAPGAEMVSRAERHAADFATRADEHDRENTYVAENFDAMKESNLLGACAPRDFGGLGVESIHDLAVAISRLGRGCPSTAISANMHMAGVLMVSRWWREAKRAGDADMVAQMEGFLGFLGESKIVISGAGTEPGTIASVPLTEATPTDDGYRINGHKVFATNSEIADSISVMVRIRNSDGGYELAFAHVLRETSGMDVRGNWDALGMRGSGSHDIVFTDCFVPAPMVTALGPLGDTPPQGWISIMASNFPLAATYVGIAETARDHIVELARTRRKQPFGTTLGDRPPVQHQVAEIEVALTSARAAIDRTGRALDEYYARSDDELDRAAVHELVKEYSAAKLIVNRAAIDVVDRALTVSGGSGYLTKSPLSRLYRDVRAGPFMQPFSPLEAYEFIGRVALGIDPDDELRAAVARGVERAE